MMHAPASPRAAEWQPPRMPKLSYRNSTPGDGISAPTSPVSPVRESENFVRMLDNSSAPGAPTICQVQGAQNRSADNDFIATRQSSIAQPQRKKPSLFGGLFTKEPTIVALAQVEADLKAKHGSATPQTVPHVSSRKMPEHVPKVNSKWDGVPEKIKARERDSRERERSSKRISLQPPSTARSRSTDPSSKTRSGTRERQNSAMSKPVSHENSWDYDTSDCLPSTTYERSSVRSSSVDSSISSEYVRRLTHRPPSTWSQSLRSPSGTSLPEITSFFPNNEPPVPPLPPSMQNTSTLAKHPFASNERSLSDRDVPPNRQPLSVDSIPEHSSSPINTPRDRSPITPDLGVESGREQSQSRSIDIGTSKSVSTNPSVRTTQKLNLDAFLAGEAKPMELPEGGLASNDESDLPLRRDSGYQLGRVQHDVAERPHSSRARLGLRASMLVRTDAAPWEAQDGTTHASHQRQPPISPKPKFSKSLGIFTK